MAEANARFHRQFSQAAPSDRIVIGIAGSDILIAIAAHRSAAARVESPRRRDCVPVSSPSSPHPGAPCKHYPITNGLIEAPVDQIGRAHVCTPVTNAHLVCRLLL